MTGEPGGDLSAEPTTDPADDPALGAVGAAADAGATGEYLLQARSVTKRFGGLVAVRDVDLNIPAGAIVSIIGPNGAGKTTFFNIVAGLIDPSAGHVRFRGRFLILRARRTWAEPFVWIAPAFIAAIVGPVARRREGR